MTDSVGGDSDAEMHWAGEGYSAFASATASTEQLTINFVDADANTKYTYTLTNPRSGIPYVEPEEEISLAAAAYKTMLLPVACAGLALVLISAGFFFDARGRKKKRKAEKAVKSLLASTIPPSASIFKTGKQMSKVRSFLRASSLQPKSMKIIDSKNTSLSVETSNLMTSSNSVPTSLQRMPADGTVEAWTSSSDNNEEPFHSTAKATRSAVAVVHRSKNGQLFAAVPMGRNEHHKRARTSIF